MKLKNHDELQASFRSWLQENSEMLIPLSAKLESGALGIDDHEQFIKIIHELSGTAGTFGYQDISEIAGKLDAYIADGGLDTKMLMGLTCKVQTQIQKYLSQPV